MAQNQVFGGVSSCCWKMSNAITPTSYIVRVKPVHHCLWIARKSPILTSCSNLESESQELSGLVYFVWVVQVVKQCLNICVFIHSSSESVIHVGEIRRGHTQKNLNFSTSFGASISYVLLAWCNYLLVLANNLVGGWLARSLSHLATELTVTCLARKTTCPFPTKLLTIRDSKLLSDCS